MQYARTTSCIHGLGLYCNIDENQYIYHKSGIQSNGFLCFTRLLNCQYDKKNYISNNKYDKIHLQKMLNRIDP